MKKSSLFLGLCLLATPFVAHAEVITLDLVTATNAAGVPIAYEDKDIPCDVGNLRGVMDSTFSADATYSAIECNGKSFSFLHLTGGDSWYGIYWDGFTLSRVAADTLNQFGCMAKGGLVGQGNPFVVGYYAEYNNKPEENQYCNIVMFFEPYYPLEVAICQSAYTYKALTEGYGPARKFTDKDTLSLIIEAYDDDKGLTGKVVYYLAVDGKFNKGWERVDLSSLGKCDGLVFSFQSTDTGKYGINTPTYFALDGLKVSTESHTALDNLSTSVRATKRIVNGAFVIVREGVLYNVAGQRLNP